jgi:hypothetical protein
MTGTTLGQLRRQANDHIQAALATSQDETARPDAAMRELCRITTTIARYLDERVPFHEIEVVGRTDLGPWELAAVHARTAMHQATRSLGQAIAPDDSPPTEPDGQPAHHLDAAASCLAAGHDLLNSHLSTDPHDQWEPRSQWAHVVTSGPVSRALSGEIAR